MKKNLKQACGILGLVTVVSLPNTLFAVTADEARGVTEITPGALEEQFASPMFTTPAPKGKQIIVPADQQKVPGQAEKIVFTLRSIKITGDMIYDEAVLRPFYADKIGHEITLAKLYFIADKITQKLRQDGYVISKAYIPPQHISSGEAEIRIIGGHIDSVSFKGDDSEYNMRFLRAYANKILASKPLQLSTLERYALLANDLPGMKARIVLSPSKKTQGAAHLTFFMTKKAVDAYGIYNNHGTLYTGPQQLAAGISANTVMAGGKVGIHSAFATEFNELRYGQLYWDQYIGDDGIQFGFDWSQTVSRPQFDLSALEIEGVTNAYAAGISYPIIRNHNRNWFVEGEFQGWNTRSTTGNPKGLLYRDTIRAAAIGTTYNFADSWRGSNSAQFKITKGVPFFGYTHSNASSSGEPSTRNKGSAVFTKFNLSASRLQLFPWRFSGLIAMKGQYTFDRLLSSQEFSYGGSQFGLGYEPSQILGDQGFSGKVEIRYDGTSSYLSQLQYFASYDLGAVWHQTPRDEDEPGRESGTSAAFGARVAWGKHFNGSLYVARPLTLKLPLNIAKGSSQRLWRGFFSVSLQY